MWWFAGVANALPVTMDVASLQARSTPDDRGRWPAFVRVGDEDREAAAARLEAQGLRVRRRGSGAPVGPDDLLVVDGSLASLRSVADAGLRLDVAPRLDPELVPPPMDVTAAQIEARALLYDGPGRVGGTGAGVIIGDIDSGIDVYHPHFFRAAGGAYAWVDVDGDGIFDPGVDSVDLNGNGSVGRREIARVLDAWTERWDRDLGETVQDGLDGELDPARDWVFVDTDGDGVRGYGERDRPAFGEPLFVPDDADGDGRLEPDERLIRLGSSLIRAVYTPFEVFEGRDITDYASGSPSHGTAVGGILAGGQLPLQRPGAGVAPDAELVFMDRSASTHADIVEFLDWAEEQGVRVMLHEYAAWFDTSLDGKGPIERVVGKQTRDDVMVHVCPAGNLADAGKHAVEEPVGGEVTFPMVLPEERSLSVVWIALHLPDDAAPTRCRLEGPDIAFEVDPRGDVVVLDDVTLGTSWEDVDGPKSLAMFTLWDTTSELPAGDYELSCSVDEVGPVHAYIRDSYGWSRGLTFVDEVPQNTMGMPSTHPRCLAVAAYGGRDATYAGEVGEIRSWSSQGPRPDGLRTLDLAAPDDPFAPRPGIDGPSTYGAYRQFGGTSGASPHVAGVAALMLSAEPTLAADEVRRLILDATIDAGDPVDLGGIGRLRAWGTLDEGPPPAEPPPGPPLAAVTASVSASGRGRRCEVELVGYTSLYSGVTYRWDVDYDGVWDTDWGGPVLLTGPIDGVVRVDAASGGYRVGGAAQRLTVDPAAICAARGCGCASGGSPVGPWLLLGLLAAARRRLSAGGRGR